MEGTQIVMAIFGAIFRITEWIQTGQLITHLSARVESYSIVTGFHAPWAENPAIASESMESSLRAFKNCGSCWRPLAHSLIRPLLWSYNFRQPPTVKETVKTPRPGK